MKEESEMEREMKSLEADKFITAWHTLSVFFTLLPNSIRLDRFCSDLAIKIKLLDAFSLGISGDENKKRNN